MINTTRLSSSNSYTIPVVEVAGPDNTKVIRRTVDRVLELTTSVQASKENPGLVTQRTNVRLNQHFAATEDHPQCDGYVQFTSSIPLDVMTSTEFAKLCEQLINWLNSPEAANGDGGIALHTNLGAPARIYAGEI